MISKITIVVIGVLRKHNQYLLTYRQNDHTDTWANDYWQFPGGGMKFGETPEKTVVREMKEELGINITSIGFIPKILTKIRPDWQGLLICYLCEYDGIQKIILNEESGKYGWFTVDEIKSLHALPGAYEIALEAEKIQSGNHFSVGDRT